MALAAGVASEPGKKLSRMAGAWMTNGAFQLGFDVLEVGCGEPLAEFPGISHVMTPQTAPAGHFRGDFLDLDILRQMNESLAQSVCLGHDVRAWGVVHMAVVTMSFCVAAPGPSAVRGLHYMTTATEMRLRSVLYSTDTGEADKPGHGRYGEEPRFSVVEDAHRGT
jgi:hypothetical protein